MAPPTSSFVEPFSPHSPRASEAGPESMVSICSATLETIQRLPVSRDTL